MNGWIILDKPSGMTSRKAGSIAARACGAKTFGHIGTLDPMASGLLPIALGNATKTIPFFADHPKEYLFSVQWGIETDTLDITGKIVENTGKIPKSGEILRVCTEFTGEIDQTPPQYSAKSVDGVRAYKLARAGRVVDIPPRKITIYELEYLDNNNFRVVCSTGTYVRALARDIAAKCGTLATVDMIRRIKTNGFDIKDAVTLDFPENLCNHLKPVDYGLGDIPVFNLNQSDADLFCNGGFVISSQLPVTSGLLRIYCNDKFIGIGITESGVIKPKRIIN